jgi:hypothetical protein
VKHTPGGPRLGGGCESVAGVAWAGYSGGDPRLGG